MDVDRSTGRLVISIDRFSGITSSTYEACMGEGYFLMTEPFMIPYDLMEVVDLGGVSVIPAGSHPVVTEEEHIRIIVEL